MMPTTSTVPTSDNDDGQTTAPSPANTLEAIVHRALAAGAQLAKTRGLDNDKLEREAAEWLEERAAELPAPDHTPVK
jgi:hypothetical protein